MKKAKRKTTKKDKKNPKHWAPTARQRDLSRYSLQAAELDRMATEFDWSRRDRLAAERGRDEGIDRAERGAGEGWMQDAVLALRIVARARKWFTTDEVWAVLGRDPEKEGRAMGAVLRRAMGLGLCKRTTRTRKSLRVICHRRDLRVWRSLVAASKRKPKKGVKRKGKPTVKRRRR